MQSGEALSAIGALDFPKEERRRLAKLSVTPCPPRLGLSDYLLTSIQVKRLGLPELWSESRTTTRETD